MDIQSNDKNLFVVLSTSPPQLVEMSSDQILSTLHAIEIYDTREQAVNAIKLIYPEFDDSELE